MATGKRTFKAPDYNLGLKNAHRAAPTRGRLGVSAVKGDMQDVIAQYLALNKVLDAAGAKPLPAADLDKINSLLDKLRSDNPMSDQEQQFLHAAIENIEQTYATLANTNKNVVVDLASIMEGLGDELRNDRVTFQTKLNAITQAQKLLSESSSHETAKAYAIDAVDVSKVQPKEVEHIAELLTQVIPKIQGQKVPLPTPDAEKIERINRFYERGRSKEGGGGPEPEEKDDSYKGDVEELYGLKNPTRGGLQARLRTIYERKHGANYGLGDLIGGQKYTEALGEHMGYVGASFRDTMIRGLLTTTMAPLVPIAEALKLPELMEITYQHLKKGVSGVLTRKAAARAKTAASEVSGSAKPVASLDSGILGVKKARVEVRDEKHQAKLLKYVEDIHHHLLRHLKKLDQPVLRSQMTSWRSKLLSEGGGIAGGIGSLIGGMGANIKSALEAILGTWLYSKFFRRGRGGGQVPTSMPTPGKTPPNVPSPSPKGKPPVKVGRLGRMGLGLMGGVGKGALGYAAGDVAEDLAERAGIPTWASDLIGLGAGLATYAHPLVGGILAALGAATQILLRKPGEQPRWWDPAKYLKDDSLRKYESMRIKIREGIIAAGDTANSTWDVITQKAKEWTIHAGDAANRMWEMLKNSLGDAWNWARDLINNAGMNLRRHPATPDQLPEPGTPEAAKRVPGAPMGMPGKPTKPLPSNVNDALITAFGKDAGLMKNVMTAESSGIPSAINVNRNGSTDYGLFQINSVHVPELIKAGIITKPDDLFTPEKNVAAAKFLYDRKQQKGGAGTEDWSASQKRWSKMEISPMSYSNSYAQNTQNTETTQNAGNVSTQGDFSSSFTNMQYNDIATPTSQLSIPSTPLTIGPTHLVDNSQAASEAITKSNVQPPIIVPTGNNKGGGGGSQPAPPSAAPMPAYSKVDDPYLSMLNIFANY